MKRGDVGLGWVLSAQFLSALADNAFLFAAMGALRDAHFADWYRPLLQESFLISFIVLAPLVGPLADSVPKGRVMLFANALKLFGAVAMLMGANPLFAYGLAGVGAAAYSPAKYGILSDLVAPDGLVKANALMEGSTIVAILVGAVMGGWLVDHSTSSAVAGVAVCYFAAAFANLFIPKIAPRKRLRDIRLRHIFVDFWRASVTLFQTSDARFSLLGTSLFWGAGGTLRFLLIAWVPVAIGVSNAATPAALNGVVAIGIALGAALAARWASLQHINRTLVAGVMLSLLIPAVVAQQAIFPAALILVLLGASGGFFVVPLNALLQRSGHETVGAGRAVAVQNFLENCAMLLCLGIYTMALRWNADIRTIGYGFGFSVTVAMVFLIIARRRDVRLKP